MCIRDSSIAMGGLFIPVSESLRVYFSFIPRAILGAVCGPVVGLVAGAVIDLTEFFLFPTGFSFFPGYTLNTMLGVFFYGLFLYRQKPNLPRPVSYTHLDVYKRQKLVSHLFFVVPADGDGDLLFQCTDGYEHSEPCLLYTSRCV